MNFVNIIIKVRDDNIRLIFYDGVGIDINVEFFIDFVENMVGFIVVGYWFDVGNRYVVWVNFVVCIFFCLI